jgi:hypothetical protein
MMTENGSLLLLFRPSSVLFYSTVYMIKIRHYNIIRYDNMRKEQISKELIGHEMR